MSEENKNLFIGIDTSCYTSSAACVCVDGIVCDERKLLSVAQGERGLRQSDGVFMHTKNLAQLIPELYEHIERNSVAGIGVSVCPSGRENSYMPVFLVGKLTALSLAASHGVPLFPFTHQQGHIRAALVGNEQLIGRPFFAFHLSGGTSDLIAVDENLNAERIGGSSDINAGQLVDRIGVKLGMSFPAGKSLEKLALSADERGVLLPASVKDLEFSFSGAETKAAFAIDKGESASSVALSIFDLIARTLAKTIVNTINKYDCRDSAAFLLAGGVASSTLLRDMLIKRLKNESVKLYFARTELASDNAVGAALLAMDKLTSKTYSPKTADR